MTANELADELEKRHLIGGYASEAATMLRQQQAEIEALKAGKIRAYDNGVEDGRKPNTNLVKELTDEEIRHIQAICHLKDVGYDNFIMRFARAILRKAKEK